MSEATILERELTTFRSKGGKIESLKIVQGDDLKWHIVVGVSWMTQYDFAVCLYDKRVLRKYKSVDSAVRHVCKAYEYSDRIMLYPTKGQ